jgi:hypothetical protein
MDTEKLKKLICSRNQVNKGCSTINCDECNDLMTLILSTMQIVNENDINKD